MNIRTALTGKTSKDHQAEIDARKTELSTAQWLAADLTEKRTASLLAGDDAAVNAVETDIKNVGRKIEHLGLMIPVIQERLENALAKEQEAHVDKLLADARAATDECVELLSKNYLKHASAIVKILKRDIAVHALIRDANAAAAEAGRTERVEVPELILAAKNNRPPAYKSIWSTARLADPRDTFINLLDDLILFKV